MNVTVKYVAQIKRASGTGSEAVQLPDNATLQDCLGAVTEMHPELQRLLFSDTGALQSTILVFVGEDQIDNPKLTRMHAGDIVTLLSPIAGG